MRDVFLGRDAVSTSSSDASASRATSSSSGSPRLVDAGVLTPGARTPSTRRAHDYRLTDKGRDLWPVLTAMRQWGDRHAAPSGPPLEVTHKACGSAADVVLVCGSCGEPVGPRDVEARQRRGHRGTGLVPPRKHQRA